MKVILAKNAGFCMGVRRAVDTTLDVIHREAGEVATFGPLIHNPQVLGLLEDRGVRILKEVPERETGTVVIRAHGVPPEQKEKLIRAGARVKDATCPHVVKVQVVIRKYREKGFATVIIGDRNHAEVEGLMGYAGEGGMVVSNEADAQALDIKSPYIIVSQTTQDDTVFVALSEMILARFPGGQIFNTICNATHKRQEEVRNLCKKVPAVVVVGGKSSANTQRLGEIAESMGCTVFMAETEADLDTTALSGYDCVGVTAGASTPAWMINRVIRTLEAIPGKDDSIFHTFFCKLFWLFLATNLYVGLAGGVLAMTCGLLQSLQPRLTHFMISFTYLFAMHNLNRFTDQKSKKFSDPLRTLFYKRYRWPLLIAAAVSLAASLTLAHGEGNRSFYLLTAMSFFGIIYSVPIIPKSLLPFIKVRGLREIPGSKTFLVAAAWAMVTVLVPYLDDNHHPDLVTAGVLSFVFLLVFVRNALFDVFEVQGDRIVGKETLPVCIGEKKTFFLLHLITGVLIACLLVMPVFGLISPLAYWLVPGMSYLIGLMYLYEKEYIVQGPKLEFWLESFFFLLAGLAWLGYT